MNITVLALISNSLLSRSPYFTGNHLTFSNCNFQKMSSLLFYNQQFLYLKNSIFNQALNEIILLHHETITDGQHVTIKNEDFQNTFQPTQFNTSQTIIDCTFKNIKDKPAIKISTEVTLYITNCFFAYCVNNDGALFLEKPRCLTMTHNCATEIKSNGQNIFLRNNCQQNDFSLFLYNTIIDCENTNNPNNGPTIFCQSGNQHVKCNNLTNNKCNAFHFDAPYCISFSMNTVMNCPSSSFQITGQIIQTVLKNTISNVNFFKNSNDNGKILRFQVHTEFEITFKNSVILSYDNQLELDKINVIFDSCIVNKNFQNDKLTIKDCTLVDYSIDYLTIHPHYTYSNICIGPILEKNTAAFGCNAGNCVDEGCNNTIGFPPGIVGYSTLIHLDLQTATFSPTETFIPSNMFSKSGMFSQSLKFSDSSKFSESDKFSESSEFSKTDQFSLTKKFTKSSMFSESDKFSKSKPFSESLKFSETQKFTQSTQFTRSSFFSETEHFSLTNKFSKSFFFSESKGFSKTAKFSKTSDFSQSGKFSKSVEFSISTQFSDSSKFSKSSPFTFSHELPSYSPSSQFSKSIEFSGSQFFSQSNEWSKSLLFSNSLGFSSSDLFSQSSNFHATEGFHQTDAFTKSIEYSQSNPFSNTNNFSSSDDFSKTSKFSNSHLFSSSKDFTNSNKFIKSQQFSLSNEFNESEFSQTTTNYEERIIKEKTGKNKLPIIIGVSVGIGVLIVAIATVAVCCFVCIPIAVFGEEEEEEEAPDVETIENFRDNPLYQTDLNSTRDPIFSDSDEFSRDNKYYNKDIIGEDEDYNEYDL